jgi:hypothetical protein
LENPTTPVDGRLYLTARTVAAIARMDAVPSLLRYYDHEAPQRYRIESYVSVPIIRANGVYFGNLTALDPSPAKVAEPRPVDVR